MYLQNLKNNKCPDCNKDLEYTKGGMVCPKCAQIFSFDEIKKQTEVVTQPFSYDKTPTKVLCDICGEEFQGQAWMMNAKKRITCPKCFKDSKGFAKF